MVSLSEQLKQTGFEGDIDESMATKEFYSHDASLFEILPSLVVYPKHDQDLERLVSFVAGAKAKQPELSLTFRSAGTDMSGGAINDSIIVDMTRYFNKIGEVTAERAEVQPGVFYRDFEKATLEHEALLPSFPASRELCAVGGMVANNSGGELSLRYGKTEKFIESLDVVLADGKSYTIKPLTVPELNAKKKQRNFEGEVYRKLHTLLEANYERIKRAKPNVSKNSTAYNLWNVWDAKRGVFDLTQLFVGSQGTLGVVKNIHFRLVPHQPYSGVLVCFMKNMDELGHVINTVLPHHPTSFEAFDNYTLNLSIKFFFYFRKTLGWWGLIKLGLSLLPDALILLRGIPKLVILIEFTGESQAEVTKKIQNMHAALKEFKLQAIEEEDTAAKAWKFRIMRRESFNLLRKKVKDKHTAPFIDDLVVPPVHLPEFLPKLRAIINKYKLLATVAGHMGDGNFHVIPLMKIEEVSERAKLEPAMREVNELVLRYQGSLSGEHNDGLIRGPWLEQMYGKHMVDLFKQTKQIFDPKHIFNPHKKTDATWEYSMSHIREHF